MSDINSRNSARGLRAEHAVAVALLVAAFVVAYDAYHLRLPAMEAGIGAKAFPFIIAAGLAVLSLLTLWTSLKHVSPNDGMPDKAPLILIVSGLLIQILTLKWLGFTIATGVMFAFSARAFGAKPWFLVLPVGFLLSFVAYLAFRYGLQLHLPEGFVEKLL